MADKKEHPYISFVHRDRLWRDRIRREQKSQLFVWPNRWTFLVNEYEKMNHALEGSAPLSPYDWKSGLDPRPLDKTPKLVYLPPIKQPPPRPPGLPRTAASWYGYKPLLDGRNLVTERQRWTKSEVFQHDLIKSLKWPMDNYD